MIGKVKGVDADTPCPRWWQGSSSETMARVERLRITVPAVVGGPATRHPLAASAAPPSADAASQKIQLGSDPPAPKQSQWASRECKDSFTQSPQRGPAGSSSATPTSLKLHSFSPSLSPSIRSSCSGGGAGSVQGATAGSGAASLDRFGPPPYHQQLRGKGGTISHPATSARAVALARRSTASR